MVPKTPLRSKKLHFLTETMVPPFLPCAKRKIRSISLYFCEFVEKSTNGLIDLQKRYILC